MQTVVKKEIKLLDIGVIHPIFDITWITMVQCTHKKVGIMVVPNTNNDFIPIYPLMG